MYKLLLSVLIALALNAASVHSTQAGTTMTIGQLMDHVARSGKRGLYDPSVKCPPIRDTNVCVNSNPMYPYGCPSYACKFYPKYGSETREPNQYAYPAGMRRTIVDMDTGPYYEAEICRYKNKVCDCAGPACSCRYGGMKKCTQQYRSEYGQYWVYDSHHGGYKHGSYGPQYGHQGGSKGGINPLLLYFLFKKKGEDADERHFVHVDAPSYDLGEQYDDKPKPYKPFFNLFNFGNRQKNNYGGGYYGGGHGQGAVVRLIWLTVQVPSGCHCA